MGKALYGWQGAPDPRTAAELASLRARVRELEAEVALLRATAGAMDPMDSEPIDLALLVGDHALV